MRTFITAFLLLLGLVAACKTAPECVDNGQCGDMQACVDDQCQDVECLSSTDCTLHQFCDDKAHACREGCGDDDDCKAGETCLDDRKCHEMECRNSVLDCSVGERCLSGDCLKATEPLCEPCALGESCDGTHSECITGWGAPMPDHRGFCLPTCDPGNEEPCPVGFDCVDLSVMGDPQYFCTAWCPTLVENGWI